MSPNGGAAAAGTDPYAGGGGRARAPGGARSAGARASSSAPAAAAAAAAAASDGHEETGQNLTEARFQAEAAARNLELAQIQQQNLRLQLELAAARGGRVVALQRRVAENQNAARDFPHAAAVVSIGSIIADNIKSKQPGFCLLITDDRMYEAIKEKYSDEFLVEDITEFWLKGRASKAARRAAGGSFANGGLVVFYDKRSDQYGRRMKELWNAFRKQQQLPSDYDKNDYTPGHAGNAALKARCLSLHPDPESKLFREQTPGGVMDNPAFVAAVGLTFDRSKMNEDGTLKDPTKKVEVTLEQLAFCVAKLGLRLSDPLCRGRDVGASHFKTMVRTALKLRMELQGVENPAMKIIDHHDFSYVDEEWKVEMQDWLPADEDAP